jgi:hypothetical protein
MTTYTVSLNNNQYELNIVTQDINLSLSRTGGQGTQGNSISDAYIDSNNDFIIEISNASGTVVQTVNVGGGTIAGQLNAFNTIYLGSKTAAPTLDNVGNALVGGALFFNTTTNELGVYDLGTTTWEYPALEATTSASNAATSEANAATSEANAATSATSSATSATNAATSETNSATSATNAATSATAAQTAETNAETAETNAETAQAAAETAETNAANSETNAATSASAAATSANNASNSETAAETAETNAATSETNAATSETNAATSETNAATSETNAATSETNAATSETNAATSETNAATSETNAAASAASIDLDNIDINGGTIDDTVIGGVTSAAGSFTTVISESLTVDTDTLHVDAANNRVGIGVTNPARTLDISAASATFRVRNSSSGNDFSFKTSAGPVSVVGSEANASLGLMTNNTERMRIDTSGKVLVNRTAAYSDGSIGSPALQVNAVTGSFAGLGVIATATSSTAAVGFGNPNGSIGNINLSGSTTSYNTASDYRLKENITSIAGAADIVKAMNPCTYNFKGDSADWHDGFLAHELQELHPRAVVGEKDEMYDEEYEVAPAVLGGDGEEITEAVIGTRSVPKYQSVDYAKLTPILTAALKEALTKIDDLETRLSAMEAAS